MAEEKKPGPFAGFVLLDSAQWDPERFKADLKARWGIPYPEEGSHAAASENSDSMAFDAEGMTVAVSFMPFPVPEHEAEQVAANNYLWPQAVEVTKGHRAQVLVAVVGEKAGPIALATLYTKVVCALLGQPNAVAVYTSGTVFPPDFYQAVAGAMEQGELPILDWVYFGLYRTPKGTSAYTYGMTAFGKDEMEILDSAAQPTQLRDMLFDFAYYVLDGDVTLRDGETIGFSEEQKLPITRSPGVAVEGDSLKIGF